MKVNPFPNIDLCKIFTQNSFLNPVEASRSWLFENRFIGKPIQKYWSFLTIFTWNLVDMFKCSILIVLFKF